MRNTSKKQEEKTSKRIAKNAKGITLVALVITIVLNCCEAAMARINKFEKI